MKKDRRVYVIAMDGHQLVKVGIARDPEQRRRDLQCANPHELTLYWASEPMTSKAAHRVEAGAHFIMGEARVRGEWFKSLPSLAHAIVHAVKDLVDKERPERRAEYAEGFAAVMAAWRAGDNDAIEVTLNGLCDNLIRGLQ